MMTTIKEALADLKIEVYSIQERLSESLELYFIRKQLDMRRQTRVLTCQVTVYRDFEENDVRYRGSAMAVIGDGMTGEEIREQLASAYSSAAFAKNRWYPLPENTVSGGVADRDEELSAHWDSQAMELAEAAFAVDTDERVFLNSLEIFARKTRVHLFNSCGVDVAYQTCGVDGEFVVQCTSPQDVETYEDFHYDRLDPSAIREKIARTLQRTRDRAEASVSPKAGKYRLILSDKYVPTVMSYFVDRSHAAYVYPGYSNYRVGDDVQMAGSEEPVTGDRIHMTLTATVPYSGEGLEMKDRVLLEDGVLKAIHGSSRFCHYLGVEPTGEYRKVTVKPGTVSMASMKTEPYLHVVNFSDFQMDSFTGSFAGEIRLAYLYDGEQVTVVTGGSVNGNIVEAQKQMALSEETQDTTQFCGPMAVAIRKVTVAGA
ncbi:MAG: hypothetical protein IJ468_04255 [Lachnospiraceae bacterium]|nr:hypothetical protein [Lachnospiraceae bacterium]